MSLTRHSRDSEGNSKLNIMCPVVVRPNKSTFSFLFEEELGPVPYEHEAVVWNIHRGYHLSFQILQWLEWVDLSTVIPLPQHTAPELSKQWYRNGGSLLKAAHGKMNQHSPPFLFNLMRVSHSCDAWNTHGQPGFQPQFWLHMNYS